MSFPPSLSLPIDVFSFPIKIKAEILKKNQQTERHMEKEEERGECDGLKCMLLTEWRLTHYERVQHGLKALWQVSGVTLVLCRL